MFGPARMEGRMQVELVKIEALRLERDYVCGLMAEYPTPEYIRWYGRVCRGWARHVARLFALQNRLDSLIGPPEGPAVKK